MGVTWDTCNVDECTCMLMCYGMGPQNVNMRWMNQWVAKQVVRCCGDLGRSRAKFNEVSVQRGLETVGKISEKGFKTHPITLWCSASLLQNLNFSLLVLNLWLSTQQEHPLICLIIEPWEGDEVPEGSWQIPLAGWWPQRHTASGFGSSILARSGDLCSILPPWVKGKPGMRMRRQDLGSEWKDSPTLLPTPQKAYGHNKNCSCAQVCSPLESLSSKGNDIY